MGKMMSAPSLVVASVAAGHAGEGCVFRAAFLQSLGLLLLISILVLLAATLS
jgi:L-lactate permease